MSINLEIIQPNLADGDDPLDGGLVALTEAISKLNEDAVAHGFLGGEFGYGARWDNDVFTMRPYYWGDCDCGYEGREAAFDEADPGHSADCYQTQLQERRRAAGLSWHTSKPYEHHDGTLSEHDDGLGREAAKRIYVELCEKHGLTYPSGCAVHCTCGCSDRWSEWAKENGHRPTCSLELPNFLHKRTGFEVRWYKWIGRGMEIKNAEGANIAAIIGECFESLPPRSA